MDQMTFLGDAEFIVTPIIVTTGRVLGIKRVAEDPWVVKNKVPVVIGPQKL